MTVGLDGFTLLAIPFCVSRQYHEYRESPGAQ